VFSSSRDLSPLLLSFSPLASADDIAALARASTKSFKRPPKKPNSNGSDGGGGYDDSDANASTPAAARSSLDPPPEQATAEGSLLSLHPTKTAQKANPTPKEVRLAASACRLRRP
jgi:hypothetical protein